MFTTPEVSHLSGATARQLDRWCSAGMFGPHNQQPGSGARRAWTHHQVRVARLLTRLSGLGAGRGPLAVAAALADHWGDDGWDRMLVVHPSGAAWVDGPVVDAAWIVDLRSCLVPVVDVHRSGADLVGAGEGPQ